MPNRLDAAISRLIPIHVTLPTAITASNSAEANKVYPRIKGHIVKVAPIRGVFTYGTIPTDLDLAAKKNTTTVDTIAVVDGSALVATDAGLSSDITPVAIDVDDYLAVDYTFTGGSTPSATGMGVIFYIQPSN